MKNRKKIIKLILITVIGLNANIAQAKIEEMQSEDKEYMDNIKKMRNI